MADSLGSLEVMEILNDPQQFGAHVSLNMKLMKYVQNNSVHKLRTLLSGYGKSKQGFDNIDPELKKQAFNIMKTNGYVPFAEYYRTPKFTIQKVQLYEMIPKKK